MTCACGACGRNFQIHPTPSPGAAASASQTSSSPLPALLDGIPMVENPGHMLAALFVALAVMGMTRKLIQLLMCGVLVAAYFTNPIRNVTAMAECWRLLRARRTLLLSLRDKQDIKQWKILSVLRNTVVDTVQGWAGQRVAVDFIFFTLAYMDSPAEVDTDLCCIGALGCWKVLELEALRRFAANSLTAINIGEYQTQ
eukprot:CAMPEP_0196586724 /NCGR_PEP_ID=MMETSP1081-20130531/55350_1 /TAXON_ID=36882 /ORGANISM="Pyramimonas amylifera, Strain CCMP720" /LENGTH=197 /DNA_ID=CAMNT_0041908699 /DNA_START=134 /DNA_END=727 /DNA_ORIENTATION=-